MSRLTHSAETVAKARQHLINFFHQASDCLALHLCEHPELQACLKTLGGTTVSAKVKLSCIWLID